MPDLDIQSFIIRYVLVSSPNDFRKSYGNMKNYQPLYGAHLTLEDENGNCQVIFILDNTPIKELLFQYFSLDSNVNSWNDFMLCALNQEISAITLKNYNHSVLALFNQKKYLFVRENYGYVQTGEVKRPIALCFSNRDMLEVCLEDLKWMKEDILNKIETLLSDYYSLSLY